MIETLSAEYVMNILAAQGCKVEAADAAVIASNLSAQLNTAHADYEQLAFEVEPALFDAVIKLGAAR